MVPVVMVPVKCLMTHGVLILIQALKTWLTFVF